MRASAFGLHPTILVLASVHCLVDGYGNVLTPLLPVLITRLDLSLAAAGTLQMCFQMASSVAQLGFGHIADRWRPRVLLAVGPLVAIALLPLVGAAPDVWTLAAVLVLGGLGCAAFHPPAAALVHRKAGAQQGLAMSFHITSGTLGQAIAPLAFAPMVQRFGLNSTPLLAIPALAAVALLVRRIPSIDPPPASTTGGGFQALRPYAKPLTILYTIVVLRTLTAMSFGTFTPVMLTRRGMSVAEAGLVTSVYLAAVGLGGFFGGPVADRIGARRVIVLSLIAAVPLLAIAPLLSGAAFVVAMTVGGFLLQSTLPVNVTFAQSLAPVSAATVSSLMMGFAWGTAGIAVPFVGMVADRIGIEYTLMAMAGLPLGAAALAVPLPGGKQLHSMRRASPSSTSESAGTDVNPS